MNQQKHMRMSKRFFRIALPHMPRNLRRVGPMRRYGEGAHIAPVTGPLAPLAGGRVLVIVDDENLTISARNLGYQVSYTMLGALLQQHTRSCALHAVFSNAPDDRRRSCYFEAQGWIPHARSIDYIPTRRGMTAHANADNLLAFTAGTLTSRSRADTVILGSGDGKLVCDIAKALVSLPKTRQVLSLSLAGSTSYRLDASTNAFLAHNIEIGLDVLRPRRR
jgi:hypothetical protein